MSLYIIIAIVAYTLFAVNGVIDKFLLSKAVRSPAVYAFYIGITGPLTLVFAPFGLQMVSASELTIALSGGACFVLALLFLYKATQQTSISRLLPIMGGFVPTFTLLFAYFLLGERLANNQMYAFIFLVIGAVIISFKKESKGWHSKAIGNALIAAILFALSFTMTKYIFDQTNFVSGLVYTRLGFVIVAIAFLIPKQTRKDIFNAPKQTSSGNKFLYYGARITGSIGGFLQNYAISLGSVTIVNALQGTQYALLLIGTIVLSRYFPKVLKEQITKTILLQKITAIALISIGLIFLTR